MSTCTSLFVPLKAAGSRDIALFVAQASQKVQCQSDTNVSNACGPWFESHDRTFSRFFFSSSDNHYYLPLCRPATVAQRLIPYESLHTGHTTVTPISRAHATLPPPHSTLTAIRGINRRHHNDRNTITSFHQNPRGVLLHRTSTKNLVSTCLNPNPWILQTVSTVISGKPVATIQIEGRQLIPSRPRSSRFYVVRNNERSPADPGFGQFLSDSSLFSCPHFQEVERAAKGNVDPTCESLIIQLSNKIRPSFGAFLSTRQAQGDVERKIRSPFDGSEKISIRGIR